MNLFELTQQAKKVLDMEDIDTQVIEDTFEGMGLEDKYASYSAVIKTEQAEVKALADAIKQLQDKKVAKTNKIAALKNMALESLQALNLTKGGNAIHSLTVRKGTSQGQLKIDIDAKWPSDFLIMEPKEDKKGLKEALKEGSTFKGFSLVDGDASLLVR